MDPAQALPDQPRGTPGHGADTPLGPPPSIGVPAIPTPPDRTRPPQRVPSADLPPGPGPVAGSSSQLAPLLTGEQAPDITPVPSADEPDGFGAGVPAKLENYVYLLVDPRTGRPLYAGQGRDDRCFRHLEAARSGPPDPGDGPPFAVLDRIRRVESSGRRVRIDVLRHGLAGEEADLVAAAVNEALGLPVATGSTVQRTPAADIGSRLAKRAKFKRSHQVVLLRVGGSGADTTYEAARHGWRIGKRWIDLRSPRSPHYAVVVAGDLVAGVHRIDGWVPSSALRADVPTATGRYSFTGPVDPELEARYVGRSVAAYLGQGTPGPVTYVWCGPHWVNAPR